MPTASTQTSANAPFLKTAVVLWLLALCGVACVLPFALSVQGDTLNALAAQKHMDPRMLLAASLAQSVLFIGGAVFLGLWSARKIGLGAPLFSAWLYRNPLPAGTFSRLSIAVVCGVAISLIVLALNRWGFAPLVHADARASMHPAPWQGLLASIYGGIDEEILMRLGLLSVLALILRTIVRAFGGGQASPLPARVFWLANLVVAIVFGLLHLPVVAAVAQITPLIVPCAVVLNGIAGLIFGALYRRYGLEAAKTAHFSGDIVLHVLIPISIG
ncbi:MAG: CPBP family glutamic-type intramembrane protease [Rhizomicrobium sp.]